MDDAGQLELFQQWFSDSIPHNKALGLKVVAVRKGFASMRLEWREELVGDPDTAVIASGVVTSLLDHCCGMAITAATGERRPTATLDLRIDYMRPAASRAGVTVEAHCYHMTRSIAFVRAHAWDADPADPIATAQAAFMLAGPIGPGTGGPA